MYGLMKSWTGDLGWSPPAREIRDPSFLRGELVVAGARMLLRAFTRRGELRSGCVR